MKTKQQPAAHAQQVKAQAQAKAPYLAPAIEVIEMQNEGVIAASGGAGVGDFKPGNGWGGATKSSTGNRSYNAAGTSELEDMINDILTVEQ